MVRILLRRSDMVLTQVRSTLPGARRTRVAWLVSALLFLGATACGEGAMPRDESSEADGFSEDGSVRPPNGDGGPESGGDAGPDFSADGGVDSDPGPPQGLGASWADRFALPGIIDGVDHPSFVSASIGEAVAVDPMGRVYVGGTRFGAAEQTSIRGVVAWDGTEWKALGRGIDGEGAIHAISASATDVYVTGEFANAGGAQANGIARWNMGRGAWTALGSGLRNGTAVGIGRVLALFNGRIILGGSFDQVSGVPARNIAVWDPSTETWSRLGNGVNGPVTAVSVSGNQLIVGGSFSSAGNVSASGIAVWDGTTWRSVPGRDDGQRPQGIVGAVAGRGNTWLIAERSTNGSGTLTITQGTANSLSVVVRSFAPLLSVAPIGQEFLFGGVGGVYRWAGTTATPRLVLSRIESTNASGAVVPAPVRGLADDGRGGFYLTGEFTQVGGVPSRSIARFDGARVAGLCGAKGQGVGVVGSSATFESSDAPVDAIVRSGTSIYVGGAFSEVGCLSAARIARWDGNAWASLGAGLNDTVRTLAVAGATLYAGGAFTQSGDIAVSRVAAWNGTTWVALGAGMDDEVSTLVVSGVRLIAGGSFRSAGAPGTAYIAVWDGARWSGLGGPADAPVRALAGEGGRIYAGGEFSRIGGVVAARIAVWDGATWSPLGAGLDGPVQGLVVRGEDVYVQGEFSRAGDVAADGFAHWDGTRWLALGDRRPASRVLGFVGDRLFGVLQGGTERAGQVATWDGSRWTPLGPPITAPVVMPRLGSVIRAAATTEDGIYFGGRFSWAGNASTGRGLFSSNLGRLVPSR